MRTATVRTEHETPAVIAAAVEPDNSPDMTTAVEGSVVTTSIERESTSGLQATVDDYVVNIDVASTVVESARAATTQPTATGENHGSNDTVTTDSKEFSATDNQ